MKLLLIFLISCLSVLANTSDLRSVKLQLLWVHQFEFAGFYMAKEKGFYKDIGVDVEISDGFNKNTIEDVDSKKVDFGVAGSKVIYEAIKGKKLVALAPTFQNSPFAWVVRKDSNITALHDFVEKTVMHQEHSLDNIELLAMLKASGVALSKINFIPTTYNIHDLIDKNCDVSSAYVSNEPYELEKAGIEYTLFRPIEYGIDFYGDILFTSQSFLEKNPQLVKDFRKASLKGWKYAFENVEETINLIRKKYNPSKSLGHLRYEANILKQQSLYPFVAVGTMDRDRWLQIAQTFKDLGYLKSARIPNDFIYDEDKDEEKDLILKWLSVIAVLLTTVTLVVIVLIRKHNRYLQRLVDERTRVIDEEKKNYETLFSKSMDGILIIQEGKFIKANDAILDMLGYDKREEFLNQHPSELSPEFQPDGQYSKAKADKMIELCMKNGTNRFEWVHTKKNGEIFWCDISLSKIMFDGQESIQVLWRDISRQKALEESLEQKVEERTKKLELATRAKSDFLANMSHEIRTPLNAIIGFIDILYKGETDTDKQNKLRIISESGYSLLTIINDILDFSKIENNKLLIETIPLNIVETFTNVVELFFDKAKENGILIKLSIDEKLPKQTLGDIVRLKQVLPNLISNAVKFTDKESNVEVSVDYLDKTNELYCEVKDYGVGISEDKIDDIFKSFIQEDSSTTRKYGGTGLGLSISKALVKLMGGKIGVKSKIEEGSTFYFSIPLLEVVESVLEEYVIECKEKILEGNILIVEDNKSNQLLMSILLDDLDLESTIANDGLEAVSMMKEENSYDLILMDENMPNMNGIEATKIIRKQSECKNIPIIAVTANALKGDREKFLKAGMDDYISKPIDAKELERILRKYL